MSTAMGLSDFRVERDKFEPTTDNLYSFPCYACRHVDGSYRSEPCRSCDHNAGAEPETEEQRKERES